MALSQVALAESESARAVAEHEASAHRAAARNRKSTFASVLRH